MWFKLLNENGNYISLESGKACVLLVAETGINTPEGMNIGCVEFATIAEAENYYKIRKLNEGEIALENIKPYWPYEDRPIYVYFTDAQVTAIVLNPQTRPLMEWGYHVPNHKTNNGIEMWFCDFANDLMSEAETEGLLLSLGAVITRKTN
jgi:hypothetical protein